MQVQSRVRFTRLLACLMFAVRMLFPSTSVEAACPLGTQFYEQHAERVPSTTIEGFTGAYGAGDFDGDGLKDAIIARSRYGTTIDTPIQILLNDVAGRFTDGTAQIMRHTPPAMQQPRELVVADFNGDGRDDVFIANQGIDLAVNPPGEPNKLLLTTPDGGMIDASNRIPQFNDFSHTVAVGDINGDGHLDLFVGNFGFNLPGSYFLINDGSGGFTMDTTRLPPGELPLKISRRSLAA